MMDGEEYESEGGRRTIIEMIAQKVALVILKSGLPIWKPQPIIIELGDEEQVSDVLPEP
jgi:hypothetical protein